MSKFYRYLIYKLYSKGLRKVGNAQITNVILTLTLTHFIQLMILYSIASRFIPSIILRLDKLYIGLFFIVFIFLNYYLFYNKEKWESYLNEFKNENDKESSKGTFLVFAYLIGTVLLFFVLMPLLFGF